MSTRLTREQQPTYDELHQALIVRDKTIAALRKELTQVQAENARLREALGKCLEDYMRWRYASPTLIDIAQAALASREGT